MNLLLAAINILIVMESGGDWHAIGDGGDAVGCLQIHMEVVEDVNNIVGHKKYVSKDRKDPVKSREIAAIYLGHYCSKERLGRDATLSDYVKCWNGGPDWRHARAIKKELLNKYAKHARELMAEECAVAILKLKESLKLEKV